MAFADKTLAEAALLIDAQAQARQLIAELTATTVQAEVRAFSSWYDSVAIAAFASRLAKLTRAGQKQTALSTNVYAGRIIRLLTGRRSVARPVDVSDGLRGVPLDAVYGRLADEWRWLEATRGADAPSPSLRRLSGAEILDRVVVRATVQADDNLMLAFRDQWAADVAEAPRITGYRRVIHPELVAVGSTKPGPVCGLCVTAADRTYHRDELLPIHARCRCGVSPIVDGKDPGAALNAADLREIYRQAGGTAAAKLKRTKYEVVQHGELGPRLVFAQHHNRSAAEAAAGTH